LRATKAAAAMVAGLSTPIFFCGGRKKRISVAIPHAPNARALVL